METVTSGLAGNVRRYSVARVEKIGFGVLFLDQRGSFFWVRIAREGVLLLKDQSPLKVMDDGVHNLGGHGFDFEAGAVHIEPVAGRAKKSGESCRLLLFDNVTGGIGESAG